MLRRSKQQLDNTQSNKKIELHCRLSASGHLRYCIWLSSMGFSIAAMTLSVPIYAAPAFGSAAWFSQASTYKPPKHGTNTPLPQGPNVINTPSQAKQNTQHTMADLNRALQQIASTQKSQSAAQQLALAKPSDVPNGLGSGGLEVAKNADTDPSLWQGSKKPTQQVKDGKTNVEIKQTEAKSILTWDSFNVGNKTTVHFNQTDGNLAKGGNEWVSLNRVADPSQKPSQILGQIKSEGSVYLLNPNGVIFGGSAQVNTNSLITSSLDIFSHDVTESNKIFKEQGIKNATASGSGFWLEGEETPQANGSVTARGAITIEKGASIQTGENGFALIAAPVLHNAGSISADSGQVILAGASGVYPDNNGIATYSNLLSPFIYRGGELVNTGIVQSPQGNITLLAKNILQDGIVGSTTSLTQPGSINMYAAYHSGPYSGGLGNPSYVGYLEFGSNALTTILPSANGATTTSTEAADQIFKAGDINIRGGALHFKSDSLLVAPSSTLNIAAYYSKGNPSPSLPFIPDKDFIAGRILLDKNATINVAGLPNVFATADNLLTIPRIGLNELADSPLLRDSFLYTAKDIVVDGNLSGIREDGTSWVGSPLLNISGYKDQKPRKIDELMVNGGTINLAGNEVLLQQGATLNIDGGYIYYPESTGNTTRLVTSTGDIQDISQADPNTAYIGIGGQFVVNSQRGNDKRTFTDQLLSGQLATYRPAYIQGGDAGTLNIFASKALFLDGDITAHAYAGMNQVLSNSQPKGGRLIINDNRNGHTNGIFSLAYGGSGSSSNAPLAPSLIIKNAAEALPAQFDIDTVLSGYTTDKDSSDPGNLNYWNEIDASLIRQAGFNELNLTATGGRITVDKDALLAAADGGVINLKAHQIQVDGDIEARAGTVNLNTAFYGLSSGNGHVNPIGTWLFPEIENGDPNYINQNIDGENAPSNNMVIGKNSRIDVSGRWVNDIGAGQTDLTGSQFIHGGQINLNVDNVTLRTLETETTPPTDIDKTGSLILQQGSVLDVSSGGYVQPNGRVKQNHAVIDGNAGAISLKVYGTAFTNALGSSPDTNPHLPGSAQALKGSIDLSGELRGYGFNKGGTLTLSAPNIQLGEHPQTTEPATAASDSFTLKLSPDLFQQQGFSHYNLIALFDNIVGSGSHIALSPVNRIANLQDLQQLTTGSNLNDTPFITIGQLPEYYQSPSSLTLEAGRFHYWYQSPSEPGQSTDFGVAHHGAVVLEKGASIQANAESDITLRSANRIEVDGTIKTPAGTIALNADHSTTGYFPQIDGVIPSTYKGADKGIWLGENSVLDVSGTSLIDPYAKPVSQGNRLLTPQTGKVLDGGSITISNDGGFIAALPGAQLNVSGTETALDIPVSDALYVNKTVGSNAGTISLGAKTGLYFDAEMQARAGDGALGGTLNIRPIVAEADSYAADGAKGLVLVQSNDQLTAQAGIKSIGDIPTAPSGVLYLSVDQLTGTGIDNLNVNIDPNMSVAVGYTPPNLYFSGDISLDLARSLQANASYYAAIPDMGESLIEPVAPLSGYSGNPITQVNINAPYIKLSGQFSTDSYAVFQPVSARGNSLLQLNANNIDIQGNFGFANFAKAGLSSKNDIRFSQIYKEGVNSNSRPLGSLWTAGDLTLEARQIYPATGSKFLIVANSQGIADSAGETDTHIQIKSNGEQPTAILSAGGSLSLDATHIEQAGVIKAPAGQINLGVTDPQRPDALAAWQNLPLVATEQIDLKPNSLTSVSLENKIVPYGQTQDGTGWFFNDVNGLESTVLENLPEKSVNFAANHINLQDKAVIDLSGGGDLQATEWIAGTGGTRDVLSRFNTSYVKNDQGEQVPLYPDQREIYAIIPGFDSTIAAFDPTFGQDDLSHNIGKQVYLSGIDGLSDGVYTLLPAQYANLPNAYRVVEQANSIDSISSRNIKMPDGTQVVAGYYVDGLTGQQQTRSTAFAVQSNEVWRQYSEYLYTSADQFFAKPLLSPKDAGRLELSAGGSLQLGATLNTSAGQGGEKAQVDIASQAIRIESNPNPTITADYLSLSVDELNQLDAGSLLIGGTRTNSKEGTLLNVVSNEVLVETNAAKPLEAPELLLAAKADTDGDDTTGGVQVAKGSVINVVGELAAKNETIIIGEEANTTIGSSGIQGDGALLRISNAGSAAIVRRNMNAEGSGDGILNIADNVSINGGKSVVLNASTNTLLAGSAQVSAKDIAVDSGRIIFGNPDTATASEKGFVINETNLKQLANADKVRLRSYGNIDFVDSMDVSGIKDLVLSAASFNNHGANIEINADELSLTNELQGVASSAPAITRQGQLNINANHVAIGQGDKKAQNFDEIAINAKDYISTQGRGTFDLSDSALTLSAPAVLAELASGQTITTTGQLSVVNNGSLPQDFGALKQANIGGLLQLTGGSIDIDGNINAGAGTVSLTASTGNLVLKDKSTIDVSGIKKQFYDVASYAPAGHINLTADQGTIDLQQGALLDFSAHAEGGNAGGLNIKAPNKTANLLGELKGSAAKDEGGQFKLDVGQSVDLNQLSDVLAASGVNSLIAIRTKQGNLKLAADKTLTAKQIELTADAERGEVNIAGKLDASGIAGGDISLFGREGVNIDGQLVATGSAKDQRGGHVILATTGKASDSLHENYGYQLVKPEDSGHIRIGANAVIDVSGGKAGGLSGGKVDIRAPLLSNGDVNVDIANGSQIKGSRETSLEAYAVWSTTDKSPNPSQHFDGVIDPAGWYDNQGNLLAGTFTDEQGTVIGYSQDIDEATLKDYLSKYIFSPDNPNTDHQTFYGYVNADAKQAQPGTLMGFIQHPEFKFEGRFKNVNNFIARPGLELQNPSSTVNEGNIQVLSPWNLTSGKLVGNTPQLDYRYQGTAPVLSLRADKDVQVKASVSDGFFQFSNGVNTPLIAGMTAYDAWNPNLQYSVDASLGVDSTQLYVLPDVIWGTDPGNKEGQEGQYYGLFKQYYDTLRSQISDNGHNLYTYVYAYPLAYGTQVYADQPSAPAKPNTALEYQQYYSDYQSYIGQLNQYWQTHGGAVPTPEPLLVPPNDLAYVPPLVTVKNTPVPTAEVGNMIPLAMGGVLQADSTSYRINAGADFNSTNPMQSAATRLREQSGNIELSGHQQLNSTVNNGQSDIERSFLYPTTLRTGVGSVTLNAAADLKLDDPATAGSIYTAGQPVNGLGYGRDITAKAVGINDNVIVGFSSSPIHSEQAGDINIQVGRDIVSTQRVQDVDGTQSGTVNNNMSQYWWPWLNANDSSSISFSNFKQGIMSVGGNINIDAGRDIKELSVSIPSTWYVDQAQQNIKVGGGNLNTNAGRDILSGSYMVSQGTGDINAGGSIAPSDFVHVTNATINFGPQFSQQIPTLLALQDSQLNVQGAQGVNIGGIYNPTDLDVSGQRQILGYYDDPRQYSQTSSVELQALGGDIQVNTLNSPYYTLFSPFVRMGEDVIYGTLSHTSRWLPASLDLVALTGNAIVANSGVMTASPDGNLNILADQNIRLYSSGIAFAQKQFTMADEYLGEFVNVGTGKGFTTDLHKNDEVPARIYSVNGDIINGIPYANTSSLVNGLALELPKLAQIYAGNDIVNLDFWGQNLRQSDMTRIVAGRDIINRPLVPNRAINSVFSAYNHPSKLFLSGRGYFDIQAGRNIGPLTNAKDAVIANIEAFGDQLGIQAVGNGGSSNSSSVNSNLPRESANISIRYGVANGIATADFMQQYIDPAAMPVDGLPKFDSELVDFMQQYNAGKVFNNGLAKDQGVETLTTEQAWTQFQKLDQPVQQLLVDKVFNRILKTTARDYNDPNSEHFQKYVRGYQAINTLYPADLGYTKNNLLGGENGAATLVNTGNLDIRGTTIQTRMGGDINIYAPGGGLLVGSNGAEPNIYRRRDGYITLLAGPSAQGILAVEDGEINIFADQSVLLAQSRIFTQQGGDMLIWSSNADINAGKGAKTSSEQKPLEYNCTNDNYCYVNALGQVTGAGIAALALPNHQPGDVYLVAPRGTVDAGDAGIRANNFIVAAQQVANADNIQVENQAIGVPQTAQLDSSVQSAANSAVAAAVQQAENMTKKPPVSADTLITVDILNMKDTY